MDFSKVNSQSFFGRVVRLPLRLIPPDAVMPVLTGRLRGSKWIAGASTHGCWLGTYEYAKQALFAKTIPPHATVFDIGGNAGFYTLLASRLVGPRGRVVVFEPLPGNLAYLRRHLELNQIENATVFEAAVSDENGIASFDGGARGELAHLQEGGALSVQTWTLDHLVELGRIPLPDFIKMDIEGAEARALRGASSLLAKAHPVIFLATHGVQVHRACCEFLESTGYRLQPIDGDTLEGSREILAVV